MTKKPIKSSNGWASLGVKVGVVAGLLGIITSSLNIFAALRRNAPPKNPELEKQVNESAPRIDVSYISMSSELYDLLKQRGAEAAKGQSIFLAYPAVSNEVADGNLSFSDQMLNTDESDDEATEPRIMCLVIQNKGKREALDVRLNVTRLAFNTVVDVREVAGSASEDYESKIREKAIGVDQTSFTLPVSIETGSGVLIPLYITRNPLLISANPNRGWSLISKIAYLPKNITFNDPLDQHPKSVEVRKMRTPIRLDNGVEVRG